MRKGFGRAETDAQGNLQHGQPGLRQEPSRGYLASAPAQVSAEGFSHPGGEQSVKVKRRKVRDPREDLQIQVLVQVLIDMLDDSVHAINIDVTAFRGRHGPYFFGFP